MPSWITRDLIADTIRTWQPYYGHVTESEAVAILLNVAALADILLEE